MTAKKHAALLLYSFVTWLAFYLLGLPDYYQSWWFSAKVAIVVLVTLAYFPVSRWTLLAYWDDGRHFRNSLWLAAYLTLPLFVYDYLLLAVYKELGIAFVVPYWYLTFFYFSFWVQIPLVGWRMQNESPRAARDQTEEPKP